MAATQQDSRRSTALAASIEAILSLKTACSSVSLARPDLISNKPLLPPLYIVWYKFVIRRFVFDITDWVNEISLKSNILQ